MRLSAETRHPVRLTINGRSAQAQAEPRMLLSDFLPTRKFAELTSLTMAGALVGDLLLLPACLVLFWKPARIGRKPAAM